jgi:hypothetical protein
MENSLSDVSGSSANGSMENGTATYAAGKMGRAYSSGNDRNISCGNPAALQITTGFTIAAWVYRTGHDGLAATRNNWVVKFLATDNQRAYLIGERNGVAAITASQDGGSTNQELLDGGNVTLNTWLHIAAVFAPSSHMAIYRNGAQAAYAVSGLNALHNSTDVLRIGATNSDIAGPFIGLIDELMIFDKALDANDVRRVMLGMMPIRRY